MNIEMMQYVEINILGIVILLSMFFCITRMHNDSQIKEQKYFRKMIIINIIILFADNNIYFIRGHESMPLYVLNHTFCIIYFLLHGYFGYLWLRYCIQKLFPGYEPDRKAIAIFLLPCLLSSLLIISSPWTSQVYSLSWENNQYHRGPYLYATMFFDYLYWFISEAIILYERYKSNRIRERSVYSALLLFPVPTVIGNLLQVKFYGLSVVWVCSAVSMLILFINLQNYQLSRDVLTGLYNRRQTNKQIAWEIEHLNKSGYKLFSIMIDVDHFKHINDKYGHIKGDEAIKRVASILNRGCRGEYFIGRFGGDEFIIIGHAEDETEIQKVIERLNQITEMINQEEKNEYKISLSAGYAIYEKEDMISVDNVIAIADKAMYKVKMGRSHREIQLDA